MFPLSTQTAYSRREQATEISPLGPASLFHRLDDPARLGSHMQKPSAMMMGGTMAYHFDAHKVREVGSVITMTGAVLGLRLSVEEVVTERVPPRRKVWETLGLPHLLVVGAYRMGFEIEPRGEGALLTVFIDYDLPKGRIGYVLGLLFGQMYAKWCIRKMAADATAPS